MHTIATSIRLEVISSGGCQYKQVEKTPTEAKHAHYSHFNLDVVISSSGYQSKQVGTAGENPKENTPT